MSYWDTPPLDRRQIVLFSATLGSVIARTIPCGSSMTDEPATGLETARVPGQKK